MQTVSQLRIKKRGEQRREKSETTFRPSNFPRNSPRKVACPCPLPSLLSHLSPWIPSRGEELRAEGTNSAPFSLKFIEAPSSRKGRKTNTRVSQVSGSLFFMSVGAVLLSFKCSEPNNVTGPCVVPSSKTWSNTLQGCAWK